MKRLLSDRIIIRAFGVQDLAAYTELVIEAFGCVPDAEVLRQRLAYCALADHVPEALGQPPYADRAICRADDGQLLGSIGIVACCAPFGQLPSWGGQAAAHTPEVGLFWALRRTARRQGYATEAATLMLAHLFSAMRLARVVATTDHANAASIALMRRLGMHIERNVLSEPDWFQTVGWCEQPCRP